MSELTNNFMKRELYEGCFMLSDVQELLEYVKRYEEIQDKLQEELDVISHSVEMIFREMHYKVDDGRYISKSSCIQIRKFLASARNSIDTLRVARQ